MLRTALKTAMAHKGRMALTSVAIMLGVAFVAGSFVFTDTIQARFNTLFADVYAGVDASLRAQPDQVTSGVTTQVATIDQSLVDQMRSRDDVAAADGYIQAFGQIIDAEGKPVGGMGPPTYVYSWVPDQQLNPFRIDAGNGRAPEASGEMVVDAATAKTAHLSIGDKVDIQFASGTKPFTLVGIASFGDSNNLAGATIAVIPLADAQQILGLTGRVSYVDMVAADGVDPQTLVDHLAGTLPAGVEAVTGDQQAGEAIDGFTSGLRFVSVALLGFAAIAVLVGAFIIHNTFRIVVAQRTRELALLRALGASAGQVIAMVLVEATAVAAIASALGLLLGLGVAQLIRAGMDAVGFGPPEGPMTVEPRTVVISLAVGIGVTLLSALLPALRASRVPPIAAMQATTARQVERPMRTWLRVAALVAGVAMVAVGLGIDLVPLSGAGAIVAVVALLTLAPTLTRPVVTVVGSPLRGVVGRLARQNATRDPRRTSATASALTIGIALVIFTAIFASSAKASIAATVKDSFPGDLIVQASNPYMAVSPDAQRAVATATDVDVASAVHVGPGLVDGNPATVTAVDGATIDRVYHAESSVDLADIGAGVLVAKSIVDAGTVSIGEDITLQLASGKTADLPVVGTHSSSNLSDYVVDDSTWQSLGGTSDASMVLVSLHAGVDRESGASAVESALAAFPSLTVRTTSEQIAAVVAQVDAMLVLFTGLLGLALLIAVLGITNTLALSVVERTREIGLLRAVGMSRRQVRSVITGESAVTALFGAVVGSVIGLGLGWVIVTALGDQGLGTFSVPGVEMVTWIVIAALAGVVAALLPARRAARLDVLRAISYE